MTIYNLTNITWANSTLEQLQAINVDLTGGFFAMLLVFALFIIIFINLSFYNISAAFMVASFFATVISGLMWLAGFVPLLIFVMAIILTVISVPLTTMTKS